VRLIGIKFFNHWAALILTRHAAVMCIDCWTLWRVHACSQKHVKWSHPMSDRQHSSHTAVTSPPPPA